MNKMLQRYYYYFYAKTGLHQGQMKIIKSAQRCLHHIQIVPRLVRLLHKVGILSEESWAENKAVN